MTYHFLRFCQLASLFFGEDYDVGRSESRTNEKIVLSTQNGCLTGLAEAQGLESCQHRVRLRGRVRWISDSHSLGCRMAATTNGLTAAAPGHDALHVDHSHCVP
jgi:hypothetical protein